MPKVTPASGITIVSYSMGWSAQSIIGSGVLWNQFFMSRSTVPPLEIKASDFWTRPSSPMSRYYAGMAFGCISDTVGSGGQGRLILAIPAGQASYTVAC